MQKLIMATLLILLVISTSFAQQDEYTRKSITFLDAVILASSSSRDMSTRQVDYTASGVKRMVQLERFDYNPIPSNSRLMSDFSYQVRKSSDLSMDALAGILNKTFVAEIVKIMDENAENRASMLVDETARMSFVATKAKDLGITAENLEKVFNSGYIYLPFINGFSESTQAEKVEDVMWYESQVSISGGILWFKIDYDDGHTSIRPLLERATSSTGFAKKKNAKDAEWSAFTMAADNYARNLEVATKDIEDFKLKTQVMEVAGAHIGFNMGRKEGVHVDDRFLLGETMMDSDGQLSFKKDGFARVKSVGNNRDNPGAMSYGYGVIVGDWAPGMSLIEYPTLPLDIYGMLGLIPLSTDETGFDLSSQFALGVEMAYNLSQIVNSSHWYLTGGAALGNAQRDDGAETLYGGITYADISVMKRFQWRRLDAYAKGGIAYMGLFLTDERYVEYNDRTYTYDSETYGAVLGGGVNLTLNIDWAVGLRYNYYLGESDTWTVKDDEDTEYDDMTFNTNHTGGAIMFQLIFSPKALGFDPLAALGNLSE
ncbi:MAG: porin family protein [Candidatus Marinimicrobia bacterium]|nr:porin family protein [Candidatus Neomarinimicrobiota bacterium]MCF7922151.1 porin family protein [Candidatus Neomarinimicrobiota bacterium]